MNSTRGKIAFTDIDGLTLENRIAVGKAIPDDVLAELKACHILLKGPTITPQKGLGTSQYRIRQTCNAPRA